MTKLSLLFPFGSLWAIFHRKLLTILRMKILSLGEPSCKPPHIHILSCVTMVILNVVKLTMTDNYHNSTF